MTEIQGCVYLTVETEDIYFTRYHLTPASRGSRADLKPSHGLGMDRLPPSPPDPMNQPSALARVRTYDELRAAIAARRRALGLSQLAFDELAGLHLGYIAKLECGTKHLGDMSLPVVLATLGIELQIVETGLAPIVKQFMEEKAKAALAAHYSANDGSGRSRPRSVRLQSYQIEYQS